VPSLARRNSVRPLILASLLVGLASPDGVQAWMQQAFYPALLLILIIASLGVPIPEDVPLIAAGVILRTHEGVATWHWTLAVALTGIMTGDLVLYSVGRLWGRDVVRHRSVSWIITPPRFERAVHQFHRFGIWYVFVGRLFMGVRAVMCMVAGATHFPYWRFFLADLAGAALSAPLFVALGYWFGGVLPKLRAYVAGVESLLLIAAILIVTSIIAYKLIRARRARLAETGRVAPDPPPVRPPAARRASEPARS
jgi:membrane protein DedA with SNARE-associated domain